MSLLLLDTTFLIDAERGLSALADTLDDDDDVAIAAVTVAELLLGVALAEGARQQARRAFTEEVLAVIPILGYDVEVAHAHAGLLAATRQAGRPRDAHDLIIAATARASGRTVITADPRGFTDLPGVHLRTHRG